MQPHTYVRNDAGHACNLILSRRLMAEIEAPASNNQERGRAMIIGNFRFDSTHKQFTGAIAVLTRRIGNVRFAPNAKATKNSPDFRVMAVIGEEDVEVGAAWRRVSQAKEPYVSVTLDDPTLMQPIHCALVPKPDRPKEHVLIWQRRSPRNER